MNIRKEQVLFVLALLWGLWCVTGYLDEPPRATPYRATAEPYEKSAVVAASLVTTAPAALQRRDFFTEPSETRPLPPRRLAFPPRRALTVCGLPLDPGPDYRQSWLLAEAGELVGDVELQSGGGDAAADATADPTADPSIQDDAAANIGPMLPEQAAKLYDRIWAGGLSKPFYGRIEPAGGVDLFALEESKDFGDLQLRMRSLSLKKRTLGAVMTYGVGHQPIDRIQLAGTLRNEVLRRVRKVPELPSAQGERAGLIDWLLKQARSEAQVYEEVLRQAEIYLQMSGGTLDGMQTMQRVLRALGDLDGELKLLEGIQGNDREMAFKLEGLGVLKSRLGLWAEAEQNLREAARLAPTDAHPHGALAEFLRQRGQSEQAMAAARRAMQTIGTVQDAADRGRILRTIVGCQLAVGDIEGARDTVRSIPLDAGQAYLKGCIAYAGGDAAAAMGHFRQAAAGADAGAALLGQAACRIALGEWQQAHDLLVRVYDQEPLLRHRAACGLALLFSRLGRFDDALANVGLALEASPGDAYALYLRGRTLRLMGQSAASEEALASSLRVRDDFLHAIAEMSAVLATQGDGLQGTEQAKALLGARNYANRAVSLSPRPELELLEWQGLRAFAAARPRAAREAFSAARDLADEDVQKAYSKGALAVVEYSRGRVYDAQATLERLERDLGRDSELGQWAGATLLAIEDHAQKEALGDGFERDEVGEIWQGDQDATLGAQVDNGRLVFRGQLTRSGSGEVLVERVGAVQKAKNFLACSATCELGARHDVGESFVGLGIEIRRGGRGVDVSARIGLRDGAPHLAIQDGKVNGRDDVVDHKLGSELLVAGQPQELELRVLQRSADNDRQLTLHAYWNGSLVHTHELKQLTRSTQTELKTVLFANGRKGSRIDVAFDDYQLERRKER